MNPIILALDTATARGSVACARADVLLGESKSSAQMAHGEQLLISINELLRELKVSLKEIEVFAVTTGPGSFTGLRTGLASVKALAQTLARPIAAIPTLHAVAQLETSYYTKGERSGENVLALLPAGRREMFAQVLRVEVDKITELTAARHLTPERALDLLSDDLISADARSGWRFAGDGARQMSNIIQTHAAARGIEFIDEQLETKQAGIIKQAGTEQTEIAFAENKQSQQSIVTTTSLSETAAWRLSKSSHASLASAAAHLAMRSYTHRQLVTPADLQALYVRPADVKTKPQV